MHYRTGKYAVCRRVRPSFSPEILQAGAVKELKQVIALFLAGFDTIGHANSAIHLCHLDLYFFFVKTKYKQSRRKVKTKA